MTCPSPEPFEVWEPELHEEQADEVLVGEMDAAHVAVCSAQRRLFSAIARADRAELWKQWGAHDMAHWLSMRYAMSWWQARRWVRAATVMETLVELTDAFARGELGLEKLLELCRFVTPETERELVDWARSASRTAVRRRADREARRSHAEVVEAEQSRSLSWWYYDDGTRFGMQADLPAADGAMVAKALDRLAAEIPRMPEEDDEYFLDARRADALVAMASARIAADADPDRATVVIHARLTDLAPADLAPADLAVSDLAPPGQSEAAGVPARHHSSRGEG